MPKFLEANATNDGILVPRWIEEERTRTYQHISVVIDRACRDLGRSTYRAPIRIVISREVAHRAGLNVKGVPLLRDIAIGKPLHA